MALCFDPARIAARTGARTAARVLLGGLGVLFALSGCAHTLPDCEKAPPFSVSPVAAADFTGISPLGNLNPPSHTFPTDHVYFEIRRGGDATASVPVVSPGHVWITRISRTEYTNVPDHLNDYKIYFQPCKSVRGYFDHVRTLSPRVLSSLGSISKNACEDYPVGTGRAKQCSKKVWIEVEAGEAIGTAGDGLRSLDVGIQDARVAPIAWANPAHHRQSADGFDDLHVACPLDYFVPATRAALDAKIEHDGDGPRCGTVAQDVPGTAAGDWFLDGAKPFPEDQHLALVHENIESDTAVISLGTGLHTGAALLPFESVSSGPINREFNEVTVDGFVYCYESERKAVGDRRPVLIFIQLVTKDRLRVEERTGDQCGPGPYEFKGVTFDFVR